MSFKMVVEYDVNIYLDEIISEKDEFILDFSVHPFLDYKGERYKYIGITISDYNGSDESIEEWSADYFNKLNELKLGIYNRRQDIVDYTNIRVKDLPDELRSNILNELRKELIKLSI